MASGEQRGRKPIYARIVPKGREGLGPRSLHISDSCPAEVVPDAGCWDTSRQPPELSTRDTMAFLWKYSLLPDGEVWWGEDLLILCRKWSTENLKSRAGTGSGAEEVAWRGGRTEQSRQGPGREATMGVLEAVLRERSVWTESRTGSELHPGRADSHLHAPLSRKLRHPSYKGTRAYASFIWIGSFLLLTLKGVQLFSFSFSEKLKTGFAHEIHTRCSRPRLSAPGGTGR